MTTYDVKIGSQDKSYADAEFSFGDNGQNNPISWDTEIVSQKEIFEIPYSSTHSYIDTLGIRPKTLVFSGVMFGPNRLTAIRNLSKMVFSTGLKRWWHNSDYFTYCFGGRMKDTRNRTQTQFISYQGAFICPIPFVYEATNRYETWNITSNDNGSNTGAFKNEGTAPAHVIKWTITNNSDGAITEVRICDGSNGSGNKITWTGSLSNGGKKLVIYLFKVVDGTPAMLKKLYYENNGVFDGTRNFDGKEPPYIEAGATNQTFSVYVNFSSSVGSGAIIRADWNYAHYF